MNLRPSHPFCRLDDSTLRRFTARSAALAVLATIGMAAIDMPLRGPAAPFGIVSFELAGTAARVEEIFVQWRSTDAMRFAAMSMIADIFYPLAYGFAFAFLTCWLARKTRWMTWGMRAAWWPLWAAVFDYLENVCLAVQLVNERAGALESQGAAVFATIKFALLAMTLGYIVVAAVFGMRTKVSA